MQLANADKKPATSLATSMQAVACNSATQQGDMKSPGNPRQCLRCTTTDTLQQGALLALLCCTPPFRGCNTATRAPEKLTATKSKRAGCRRAVDARTADARSAKGRTAPASAPDASPHPRVIRQ